MKMLEDKDEDACRGLRNDRVGLHSCHISKWAEKPMNKCMLFLWKPQVEAASQSLNKMHLQCSMLAAKSTWAISAQDAGLMPAYIQT